MINVSRARFWMVKILFGVFLGVTNILNCMRFVLLCIFLYIKSSEYLLYFDLDILCVIIIIVALHVAHS